jgi:hypothetical protein
MAATLTPTSTWVTNYKAKTSQYRKKKANVQVNSNTTVTLNTSNKHSTRCDFKNYLHGINAPNCSKHCSN